MRTPIEQFLVQLDTPALVADVGAGPGHHSKIMMQAGASVVQYDYKINGRRFLDIDVEADTFDGLWCSHTLEHCRDVGLMLDRFADIVKPGGVIAICVPPLKHNIVGGHLSLWNAGLLIYNLTRAHIDCRQAMVQTEGYNVAVIVRNNRAEYNDDDLNEDNGDIEKLAAFFPIPVKQGFDGRLNLVNWT